MTDPTRQGGARALARRAVKAQVSAMALDLFVVQGYDVTTVDDICAAVGISRSTFFRYFSSKEDVLLADTADANEHLVAALRARPDSESVWEALRRSLDAMIDRYAGDPERSRRLAILITTTPALAAAHHEKNARWSSTLLPEIARRLGAEPADPADPRPAALVAAALGCVDATIAAWAASDGREPLSRILDRAMSAVGTSGM